MLKIVSKIYSISQQQNKAMSVLVLDKFYSLLFISVCTAFLLHTSCDIEYLLIHFYLPSTEGRIPLLSLQFVLYFK